MLRYALLFFVLAIVLAALGVFSGVSGILLQGAWALVVVFVILAIVSAFTGRGPSDPLA